ncbi:MAG TPA: hypothetical protein VIY69_18945 [Candidatus Acidoferrales bacterium]
MVHRLSEPAINVSADITERDTGHITEALTGPITGAITGIRRDRLRRRDDVNLASWAWWKVSSR